MLSAEKARWAGQSETIDADEGNESDRTEPTLGVFPPLTSFNDLQRCLSVSLVSAYCSQARVDISHEPTGAVHCVTFRNFD
jgi:hypothetical protein